MTQFVNQKQDIVTDAVNGIIAASNGKLARLDGYPHIRVVVRNDWDKSKVALVSGGGAGHEPSHVGFIGKGMLTAAVCGDVFASPSTDAVLAGILAVTGAKGCLLIVKNYTGDRLNFGLAAERARVFGLKVDIVIVDDDIALPELSQARGLAGTLFVHKITGQMAEDGQSLSEISKAAKSIISRTKTIGMSVGTCTIPGSIKENRIPEGMAELGLGIHGEPGVEKLKLSNAKSAMTAVVKRLSSVMDNTPHVALLNNLGATSALEMSILSNELINSLIGENVKFIIGPAPMMTSLDMHGFSISVFAAKQHEIDALSMPIPLSSWPGMNIIAEITLINLPDGLAPIKSAASSNENIKKLITKCCQVFIDAENDLNILDAKSGDGDTGSTLAGASRALIKALDSLPLADTTQLYRAIGQELSQTMGGCSGALLAIFFAAAGDASAKGFSMRSALQAGLVRMQEIGGAKLNGRTMVDALHPALNVLDRGFAEAANAARAGAEHTATILKAKVGRSSYISAAQLEGHIDPGAEAVALLFEALAD